MSLDINTVHQGDCLELMKDIPSGSIDLVLTDPPYGTVNGASLDGWSKDKTYWDNVIPFDLMWLEINRVLRKNGKCILFSQEPYTSNLINSSIPNLPFNYRNIWLKNHFANTLLSKKAPVSYYEDICVFSKTHDLELLHPLRDYARSLMQYIGLNKRDIISVLGQRADHFFRYGSPQFGLCTETTYCAIIEYFKIDKWEGFKCFEELKKVDSTFNSTFNLWQGNKFKSNIFEYKKEGKRYHPTQKPILLLEDLIKTYSNKGDKVLDFTMGSGTTGVACQNTNRSFIGIELDKEYFEIAKQRLAENGPTQKN